VNLSDPHDQSRPSWKLYNKLLALGVPAEEAGQLMNGYAHELAEQLREQCDCGEIGTCGCPCADLIDPEVKR
jgi:hypothetical protein